MFKIKDFADYKATKIERGWSEDEKYLLEAGQEKLLLKLTDINYYDQKFSEFEIFNKLEQAKIPSNKPIGFGICDSGEKVWMALTWVDGVDLRDQLLNFSKSAQYDFGLEAGRILRKIHALEIPEPVESWEVRFNKKIDRKLLAYEDCDLKIRGGDAFISYLAKNRHLLAERPQCFHHGDFHEGNLILTADNKVVPIDFNRFDYGDPWEEFNRIVFSKDISPEFASGQVDGYFNGVVPDAFWKLLALYISSNTISSIPWAIPFGEGEVEFMMKQAEGILKDYDNMKTYVPTWYQTLK